MHKLAKQGLALGLVACLSFAGLVACGKKAEAPSTEAAQTETQASSSTAEATAESSQSLQAPEGIRMRAPLKIGVLKIADSLPLYVGEAEGLFRETKVPVEVVEFANFSDQTRAYEAGALDGLMTDLVVESLLNKGKGKLKTVATALGADVTEGRFALVGSPSAQITKPEDLKGKRIGMVRGSIAEFLVTHFLAPYGMGLEDFTLVPIPNLGLRMDALMKGKDIDVAFLPDPLASLAVKQGATMVIDDTKLQENLSMSVIAIRQSRLEEDPLLARDFRDGYNAAIEKINGNPDAYREMFLQIAKVPKALAEDYPMSHYTPNAVPDEAYVKKIQDWMLKTGLLEKAYDYEALVYKSQH